ncbi:hypothetical protein EYF80_028062 [Liparis tanakae]|uniref:Uncharacterized protein n=1 Tax=Liparis tanakae TaxID=230148 RepID=A0A4Z2H859_9TELE|nr:hypothetical protein EYF80_028062 [Liparis tanakae]
MTVLMLRSHQKVISKFTRPSRARNSSYAHKRTETGERLKRDVTLANGELGGCWISASSSFATVNVASVMFCLVDLFYSVKSLRGAAPRCANGFLEISEPEQRHTSMKHRDGAILSGLMGINED